MESEEKKPGNKQKTSDVANAIGAGIVILMVWFLWSALFSGGSSSAPATAAVTPPSQSNSAPAATTKSQTETTSQAAPSVASGSCAQAAHAAFQKVVALYTTAYQDGKQALGTTQYPNASAGLQAMTVPGSAASNFSGWHKTWNSQEQSLYDLIVKSYSTASDCYYNSNQTEPDVLGNWRDDTAQLDSDISAWGSDATDWQVRAKPTSVLTQDEANISADLTAIQKDLSALK